MLYVQLVPLGGILGSLKSVLALFWPAKLNKGMSHRIVIVFVIIACGQPPATPSSSSYCGSPLAAHI